MVDVMALNSILTNPALDEMEIDTVMRNKEIAFQQCQDRDK
jgi:hypothetical protein